ncbi:MAG: PEP-CTERM sorting domain-containing protein [Candidatus Rokubacteria bacterium]|nr:PEP-CTERM sorting domain-containing protein [Candidatus Rokubacteria bacterium]
MLEAPTLKRLLSTAVTVVLMALLAMAPAVQAGPATVVQNFSGISLNDEIALGGGAFIPPDQGSAVGPNHYMEMVNLRYAIYNKNGTVAVPITSLNTFFANAGVTVATNALSDPRLVYDQSAGRWVAVAITTNSDSNSFVLAVSQTSDPTGAWKAVAFQANTTANNFADYPTIAVDKNGFYVATNNFQNGTTFSGVGLTTIPKADVLNAAGPVVTNRTHTDTVLSGGTAGTTPFTLAPVSDFANRDHGVIIATDGFTPATVLHRYSVLDPGSNASTLTADSPIAVLSYANNQNAHQPDGTRDLNGVDFRIGANNVYQVGNVLWAAQSVLLGPSGNSGFDAIRWYEIDETTNLLLQTGLISDLHHDYIDPAIAANAAGDVIIGFTASGDSTTTDFPGSWFAAGTTSGGVTTFGAPQMLLNGAGSYHIVGGGRNRWGDYSAISIDPNDSNTFWIADEASIAGNPAVTARPFVWGTQISAINFPSAVPEPGTLVLLTSGLIVLSVRRRGRRKSRDTPTSL